MTLVNVPGCTHKPAASRPRKSGTGAAIRKVYSRLRGVCAWLSRRRYPTSLFISSMRVLSLLRTTISSAAGMSSPISQTHLRLNRSPVPSHRSPQGMVLTCSISSFGSLPSHPKLRGWLLGIQKVCSEMVLCRLRVILRSCSWLSWVRVRMASWRLSSWSSWS